MERLVGYAESEGVSAGTGNAPKYCRSGVLYVSETAFIYAALYGAYAAHGISEVIQR